MARRANSRNVWWQNHYAKLRAAKERKRLADPDFSQETNPLVPIPRPKARFRILIEDQQVGDRLQIKLYPTPFRGQFATGDGIRSVRQLERAFGHILRTAFTV
jgi:hypothetical protein